jgi:hypothetical protein
MRSYSAFWKGWLPILSLVMAGAVEVLAGGDGDHSLDFIFSPTGVDFPFVERTTLSPGIRHAVALNDSLDHPVRGFVEEFPEDNRRDWETWSADAAGLLSISVIQARETFLTLEPAVQIARAELVPGDELVTIPSGSNAATGHRMKWTSKVMPFETLDVAGTPLRCARIHLVVEDEKVGTRLADLDLWFAKQTGLVMRRGTFFGVHTDFEWNRIAGTQDSRTPARTE